MRIVVTRPEERAAELVERLEALGHEVAVRPLIAVESLSDEPSELGGYDWVVVTSRTGAELLAGRAVPPWPRIAVIGPGTADALRAEGLEPALMPQVSSQEGLASAFPRPAGRVLFAGAEGARRHLVDALDADFLPLYRTVERQPGEAFDGDLVVLASPSAARTYGRLGSSVPAVSIGPETTRAAQQAGVRVAAEAATHDLDGLVAAVELACSLRS
jgi:uroporphyrinogen-III synthase